MRIAVVGGKLQGIETCYLARRAGWEVVLIDRDPRAPASGLCSAFFCRDIVKEPEELTQIISDVDLIVPAVEDFETLQCLAGVAKKDSIPLALDLDAYAITSSKKASDHLFHRLALSVPQPWPDCGFPVIVKPDESSGSKGVRKIADQATLDLFLEKNRPNLPQWVIQEYLEGPSYSLEVVGLDGRCVALQPTVLEMDVAFDCKRVIAPAGLSKDLDAEFRAVAGALAQTLSLTGVMDLEVVYHGGSLKILEIDARLPSQTPSAVERSTGINILECLRQVFVESRLSENPQIQTERGVVYEHIRVWADRLEVSGEHIMTQGGPLHMENGFFGADTALTNFSGPDKPWVATLIISDTDLEKAWKKRCQVIRTTMEACRLSRYRDPVPDGSRVRTERSG
ncbi:MAG: 3-methylornithine--L-lysine ligase PylC [Proteobacteria bacterium]|nr:3-methylornithine--L-lysine ligase PylC [Pseudomonadota bacterium]NIS70869.1 3-methylornithine--L-lysine ligase PylC [Pseudomonadota bacterium]